MRNIEIISKTNKEYPKKLLQIPEPPTKLYVEGNKKLLKAPSIAIVGSRDATEYGKEYAAIFAKQIAKAGITIISGMAIGIDSVAHINSMKEIGKTIAVLGYGLEQIYNKENYYLYRQIIENDGCIISEYPAEQQEAKENYPRRNRIISGLAMGVLVVEAKARSGSTITARLARRQKKEIFCIPNKLGEKTGYSTNLLIKEGANLVTCPQDILSFYSETNNAKEEVKVPEEYKDTYEIIGKQPISANEIAKITKKPIAHVTQVLCMLEIEGVIESVPGSKYIKV